MMQRTPPDLLTELLARREHSLRWLVLLAAALIFCLSAGLLADGRELGAVLWAPLLGGGLWAGAALWIVARTRAEGEPPDGGPALLLLAALGQVLALGAAGRVLLGAGAGPWGWGWVLLVALGLPWRTLLSLLEADPGRRIERLWVLHGAAGRLLALGALASVWVLWPLSSASAALAMAAVCGVILAVVSAQTRAVAVGLDQVRLVVPDLPPQPSRDRLPGWMVGLSVVSLLGSGLWTAPWPSRAVVASRLVEAGWLAPADGRLRWLVLVGRERRPLTRTGPVTATFSPTAPSLVATAGGSNPAFWILHEGLGWYPEQLRDVWDVTEVALSPDGETLALGRRHGALQLRALQAGRAQSAWAHSTWTALESHAPGGRLHYLGSAPVALAESSWLLRWQAAGGWEAWLSVGDGEPVQGFVPAPDGRRVALLIGSREVAVLDTASGTIRQRLRASGVRQVAWTADGQALVVAGQGVERIRLADGQRTRLLSLPVTDIALDAAGRLAVASYGVRVLDAESGTLLLEEVVPASGAARSVSWHPDGLTLAIGTTEGEVELWRLREHRLAASDLRASVRLTGTLGGSAVIPQGR